MTTDHTDFMDDPSTNGVPVHLVFGASGGIGSAVCRQLSASSVTLALASRPSERLEELGRELHAPVWELDIRDPTRVESIVEDVMTQFGRIDGVANCIGSLLLKPAHRTSFGDWDATIAANLTSAFAVVRAATTAMRQHGGSIVLVSTAAARIGLPNHDLITWLLEPGNSWITGQVVGVDGGLASLRARG
jgi:3-oxoacyl-[acyl-carrier protein] reductase